MMCAIPKARSLSLDSSASQSGKLVCSSAGKFAKPSSTFKIASDRAQLVRPVVSVKATASAGHSPQEKSRAQLNGVASHTHHLTGNHKHLHHQLQTTLVAAHAVGYCNGIRHQAGQGSLIFSRDNVGSDLDCKPDCNQPQAQQPRLQTQHSAMPRQAPVDVERLRQPAGISQHSPLPASDTKNCLPQRQQVRQQQQQHHEPQQHHMQQHHTQQQHVSQHQTQTLHQQTATTYPRLSLGRRSSDPHSGTHAQGQPSSPTAHSGEKRSRVMSIAEASSEANGRRPNPFIKIRCSQAFTCCMWEDCGCQCRQPDVALVHPASGVRSPRQCRLSLHCMCHTVALHAAELIASEKALRPKRGIALHCKRHRRSIWSVLHSPCALS